jgi:two-component system CheB/CheR fusion protein
MAIGLIEFLGDRAMTTPIQIFGTDASDKAIERARAGYYLDNIAAEVSPERLQRFFVKLDGHYGIAKPVRDLCVFARHNVSRDPPFSRLDLVSCCNLLIYFDQALQRQILSVFHYALKPRGFLVLGPSESVGQSADLFALVDKKHRIYARKAVPGRPGITFREDAAASPPHPEAGARTAPAPIETDRVQREADRVLLARHAPPCVVIDEELNVLQFRGQTASFLEHAAGPASLNLQKLAPAGLLIALAPALQEARTKDAPVRREEVRIETQTGARKISFEVSPFRVPEAEVRCYLVLFEDARPGREERPPRSFWASLLGTAGRGREGAPRTADQEDELTRLQRELAATREYLQAAVEEHEAAQEELKSAHEEVLSSNEEFQSTNEELETAKEELQSANEELSTTNDELRDRNRELTELNQALRESRDFAEIIVETVREPLLVLDGKLHVTKANRAFYHAFHVAAPQTEGRLLYDLGNGQWNIPELRKLLEDILPEHRMLRDYRVTHTFPEIGTRTMLVSASRLTGNKHRLEMILLGIDDVTERMRHETEMKEADRRKDEFLAMLAHELRSPLAPIHNALEIMQHMTSAEPNVRWSRDVIRRQVNLMVRLVDDLLDVSRITNGQIVLQKERLHLADVIERAVETSRPVIDSRKHKLEVAEGREPIYVEGDAARLAQVLSNLLNNAAKYTPEGGEIKLSAEVAGDDALLRVSDSGMGISPDLLPHVFDMFSRAPQARANDKAGLGIGLTLALRLVKLHGGTIEARSEGIDKGSEFIVRLPRLPGPDDESQDSGAGNETLKKDERRRR